ncbi:MAG TPA: DinB family protein [Jiangellaceae bacterium]|nr:DinB family protein [Jiangellaceae bacterium]
MTGTQCERASLSAFLQAQRSSVLAIVDGLGERDMHRPVVPSGWTPLGMIEHLTHAESFWFERVITGTADSGGDLRGAEEADDHPFATLRPVHEVVAGYREQVMRSVEILASAPIDTRPAGHIPPDLADEIHTVRDIALHMIEEIARHAGHLDIARELIDGQTGLGPR